MAVTVDEMLEQWTADSIIDDSNIQSEIIKVPSLHSKFLNYYIYFKQRLAIAESKKNKMSYLRKRYYRGELTREELVENKWDQYQGLKMSNTEYNQHSNIDPILVDYERAVAELKLSVSACEYILASIKSRDYSLKTIFEHMKYMSGS